MHDMMQVFNFIKNKNAFLPDRRSNVEVFQKD